MLRRAASASRSRASHDTLGRASDAGVARGLPRARAMGITCRCDPRYSARASPRCLAPAPAPAPSPPRRPARAPRIRRASVGVPTSRGCPAFPSRAFSTFPPFLDAEYASRTRTRSPSSAHATMPCCGSHLCASCDQLWFATESTCPSCRAPVCRPGGRCLRALARPPRTAPHHPRHPKRTAPHHPRHPKRTAPHRPRHPHPPRRTSWTRARRWRVSETRCRRCRRRGWTRSVRVVALEAENDALRRRLRDVEAALTAALDQNRSVAKDDTRRGDPAHPARPADPVSDVGRDDSSATSSLWRFANDASTVAPSRRDR